MLWTKMNGNQFDDFYGQLDIENLEWREREKKIEKEGKRLQRIVLLLTTKKKSAFAILCFILEEMDKGNIHFNFQFF